MRGEVRALLPDSFPFILRARASGGCVQCSPRSTGCLQWSGARPSSRPSLSTGEGRACARAQLCDVSACMPLPIPTHSLSPSARARSRCWGTIAPCISSGRRCANSTRLGEYVRCVQYAAAYNHPSPRAHAPISAGSEEGRMQERVVQRVFPRHTQYKVLRFI